MERLKNKQVRNTTSANYFGIWRNFNNFLIRLDQRPSSWENRLILYCTYLVEKGTQSSTIKSYISAIKHVLRCDGYVWDQDQAMLTTITRSCRLINDTVRVRLPISRQLLDMILLEVKKALSTQPYLRIMYTAVFVLAYYGLMRIGELTMGTHPILTSDIHVGINKDKILMRLRTSKTHGKESSPQEIKIEAAHRCKHTALFCPFTAVCNYLTIRGHYGAIQEPFFVFSNRSPVSPDNVRLILCNALISLNLDASLYGMHSMRAGRATDMYKMGYSICQIQKAWRWKSGAVYKYIKC